jgi:hypothetical protein
MSPPAVHVHTWRNEYIVPREHLALEESRIALDAVARDLPGEFSAGLQPLLAIDDDGVLLLKRIAFDCELDLTRERSMLASRWAYAFARALMRASDTECDGVLRFHSAAAFRARFVRDLAAGQAWHCWYYKTFEGLRHLSVSGAVRTLLLEDPTLGRCTLLELPPTAWDGLASCINRGDALRIIDGLSGEQGDLPVAAIDAMLHVIDREIDGTAPWFVRALRVFHEGLHAGAVASPALAAFVRIAGKIATCSWWVDTPSLAGTIASGDITALARLDDDHDLDVWSALNSRPEWRPKLSEVVERIADHRRNIAPAEERCTGFGGLVFLLAEIDVLLTPSVVSALPRGSTADVRNLAAWIALAQAAGASAATRFARESFWRDLLSISPDTGLDTIQKWLAGSSAHAALAALADEAGGLMRGESQTTSLQVSGGRRTVVVDTASSLWMRFEEGPARESVSWPSRLKAARVARADWMFLAAPWNLPPEWRLFFVQLAQIGLRRFAYRIPGFRGSSLAHLSANFLGASGRSSGRGSLRLSRPPLYPMLQLTGIARGRVKWSGPPSLDLALEFDR